MGRPNLFLPWRRVVELHDAELWSIREIARYLGVSRWSVRRTLTDHGVTIREDVDAASLVRYLAPEPESLCMATGCDVASRSYCPEHQGIETVAIELGACAVSRCIQRPPKGRAYCYGHEKQHG